MKAIARKHTKNAQLRNIFLKHDEEKGSIVKYINVALFYVTRVSKLYIFNSLPYSENIELKSIFPEYVSFAKSIIPFVIF